MGKRETIEVEKNHHERERKEGKDACPALRFVFAQYYARNKTRKHDNNYKPNT